MTALSLEQIRRFRLHAHHLDAAYPKAASAGLTGACGLQNTPPGAWETALFNRAPDCSQADMDRLLYRDRTLLQAWSLRGAPLVFPTSGSDVFLSALTPEEGEPWIYTAGIQLALDVLQLPFDALLAVLQQVLPRLDACEIVGKNALDQTLAAWMRPLLPAAKRDLWDQPSMYGSPDKQTVGGAVVSFLLRPCALNGQVVFGERKGSSPVFTSYRRWTGRALQAGKDAPQKLVRTFLRCHGPATADSFSRWLGCSGKQARRMWATVAKELEPVSALGKKASILAVDRDRLFSPAPLQRELLLLGGHDPYLDPRDRSVLQPDASLHKHIWKTVANPGAIVYRGEIIGVWTSRKKDQELDVRLTLWSDPPDQQRLTALAEQYAAFRQLRLARVEW